MLSAYLSGLVQTYQEMKYTIERAPSDVIKPSTNQEHPAKDHKWNAVVTPCFFHQASPGGDPGGLFDQKLTLTKVNSTWIRKYLEVNCTRRMFFCRTAEYYQKTTTFLLFLV